MYLHPDLHLHSTVSDGSDTPLQLLEKIRNSDIDIFSLTDHDSYFGCEEIKKNLRDGDPTFLGGIELTCRDELGKYHILGYCYDVNKPSIVKSVEKTHLARRSRANARIRFLQETKGFEFTKQELDAILENENPGKPHFVSLLLKKGYVKDKAEGFALMSEFKGEDRKLTPEEAIDAILSADGIPVLAHGILGDGAQRLTAEEISSRVKRLKDFGLMGLECYYSTYTKEQTEIMLSVAKENNLMITAGSDYHGKNKPIKLGESGNPDAENMERFYRTAKFLLDI